MDYEDDPWDKAIDGALDTLRSNPRLYEQFRAVINAARELESTAAKALQIETNILVADIVEFENLRLSLIRQYGKRD